MPICNQCGKPAVQSYNGSPLCVDCLSKLMAIFHKQEEIRQRELMILMQQEQAAEAAIYQAVGLPTPKPKYDFTSLRPPSSYAFHNIHLNDSVVGSVNTGDVEKIDVAMTNIKNAGNDALATSLKELTEAVLESQEIGAATKREIVENVAFISQQLQSAPHQRKLGPAKAILQATNSALAATSNLINIWLKVEPVLRSALGL